jgi:hypothetical protein
VSRRVDPDRAARHDDAAMAHDLARELPGKRRGLGTRLSRSDHGERPPGTHVARDHHGCRRLLEVEETLRIARLIEGEKPKESHAHLSARTPFELRRTRYFALEKSCTPIAPDPRSAKMSIL